MARGCRADEGFPFLLGRAFIEAAGHRCDFRRVPCFPFLLGRAFIEALLTLPRKRPCRFSLPSGKGFH